MSGYEKALADLAENTQANKSLEDYEKNGLLYCGKCNTAKQARIFLLGKEMKPYCMCKCEEEAYKQEQENIREQLRKEEMERNRDKCFIDINMRYCNFDSDDRKNPKISDIAKHYVQHFDVMYRRGKGLLFLGNAGTGKSFIAACIVNELLDRGYKCLMTNFPRIINELTGIFEGKQAYIDSLNTYDLLVIDDLAIERETEYTAEIIQNVIDSRYRAGKPIIITSNLSKNDFDNPQNIKKERLYSRLYEMCLPLAVVGKDRRKENAAVKDDSIKDLLGI